MAATETGQRTFATSATGYLVDYDGSILTPKFAKFTTSTATANVEVVAAVAGKKIRVLAAAINADGDVDVHFRSASTAITGTRYIPSSGGGSGWSYTPLGRFETATGEALNVYLSAAIATSGEITYVEASA